MNNVKPVPPPPRRRRDDVPKGWYYVWLVAILLMVALWVATLIWFMVSVVDRLGR